MISHNLERFWEAAFRSVHHRDNPYGFRSCYREFLKLRLSRFLSAFQRRNYSGNPKGFEKNFTNERPCGGTELGVKSRIRKIEPYRF